MRYETLTIPALGTATYRKVGKVFSCISATASFQVQPDNGHNITLAAGRGFGSASAAEPFTNLVFRNTTGGNVDVTFYWGLEDFRPDPSVTAQAVTVTSAVTSTNASSFGAGQNVAVQNLASGVSTAPFTGVDGNGKIRKQFFVANYARPLLDPSSADPDILYVLDANDKIVCPVYPQRPIVLECGGTLKVKNASPNAINYSVGEIYYS